MMSIHAELLDAYSEGMLNLGTSALSPDVNVQCNSASGFSSTLVELDLKGNYYTQEGGGRAMAESLRLNTTHTSAPVLRGSTFAGIGWEPKTQTPNPKPQTLRKFKNFKNSRIQKTNHGVNRVKPENVAPVRAFTVTGSLTEWTPSLSNLNPKP